MTDAGNMAATRSGTFCSLNLYRAYLILLALDFACALFCTAKIHVGMHVGMVCAKTAFPFCPYFACFSFCFSMLCSKKNVDNTYWYARKKVVTWGTVQFATALRGKLDSCSLHTIIPPNSITMEQDKGQFYQKKSNPLGVGPHFGKPYGKVVKGRSPVKWFDGQDLSIKVIMMILCPEKGKVLMGVNKHGKKIRVTILSYTKKGVRVSFQVQRIASPTKKKPTDEGDEDANARKKFKRDEEGDEDAKWGQFNKRAKPLTPEEYCKMVSGFTTNVVEMDFANFSKGHWFCFLERLIRQYRYNIGKLRCPDPMHLDRDNILGASLATVLNQVRPRQKKNLPCEGDKAKLLQLTKPIVETTLGLPGPVDLVPGTQAWCDQKISQGEMSFRLCAEYEPIMEAFIAKAIAEARKTDETDATAQGFPHKDDTALPPASAWYQESVTRRCRPRAKVCVRP